MERLMERSMSARNQSSFSKWRTQLECWWKSFERIIKRPICQKINAWHWSCLEESFPCPRMLPWLRPSEISFLSPLSSSAHHLEHMFDYYDIVYVTDVSLNSSTVPSPKWFLYSLTWSNITSPQFSTCASATSTFLATDQDVWPFCI